MTDPAAARSLAAPRDKEQLILADMQQASDAVDEANGTNEYQVRLVALALIARHFLREYPALAAARLAVQQENERLKEWKEAIIDAAVCDWILTKEHETNPRKAVNDLLCWQQKIALDPAVSKEAHDLHQRADVAEAALTQLKQENEQLRQQIDAGRVDSWGEE